MSSPAAGKFQDHYEVLGVDHKAGTEAIQAAYSRLSDKYHPKTGSAPDVEKYESVTLAFEVLGDPTLRSEFDKLKGIGGDDKPRFSGVSFFEAYRRDTILRVALLCVLYDRRRTKPFTPSLSMRHLEAMLSATSVELNFALWYLKQRELVMMDDKSSMQITADGMDYLQMNPPDAATVMQLIKASATVSADGAAGESVTDTGSDLAELAKAAKQEAELPLAAEAELEPVALTAIPAAAGAPTSTDTAARIGSLLARRNQN